MKQRHTIFWRNRILAVICMLLAVNLNIFGKAIVFAGGPGPITSSQEQNKITISQMQVSAVKDQVGSVIVTWRTSALTKAWIEYGTAPNTLNYVAFNTRGAETTTRIHKILIRGIEQPHLYFSIVLANGQRFNNSGQPFHFDTIQTQSTATIEPIQVTVPASSNTNTVPEITGPVMDAYQKQDAIPSTSENNIPILDTHQSYKDTRSVDTNTASIANTASGFDFPLNPTWTIGYDRHPVLSDWSNCYNQPFVNLWHSGLDWGAPAGTAVKSVADGIVVFADPNYSYPGNVIIIKHILPDSSVIYSMYGHLGSMKVSVNANVTKSQVIGTVLYQTYNGNDNSHLHWEIRSFQDGSSICSRSGVPGPGYTYPDHPDTKGYKNPYQFVIDHKAAQQSVTVQQVYTTDGNGSAKTSFRPGDTIRYYARVTNSGSSSVAATLAWLANGPAQVAAWSGTLSIAPGTADWYLGTTLPSNAPSGTYTLRVQATYNGTTSQASSNFSVTSATAVTVQQVYTTDGNGSAKTSFRPGDTIRYYARVTNSGSSSVAATLAWLANGPAQVAAWSGTLSIAPGTADWYLGATLPSNAPSGTYTLRVQATYNGTTSQASSNFSVTSQTQGETIVDELSSGFSKSGQYWWDDSSRGLNGHMYWTYVNGTVESSSAVWRPNLPTGRWYEVFAYIPDYHTNTVNAVYELHYSGNNVSKVPRQQAPYANQWISLGIFYFDAGTSGYVRLTDASGESAGTKQMGFDAIKWVPR